MVLTSQMAPMMTLDAKAQTPTMVAKVASSAFLSCTAQQYPHTHGVNSSPQVQKPPTAQLLYDK